MTRLIKFFLTVLLGTSLGYAWATYHAYLRYAQYEKQIFVNETLLLDYEYRLKQCKTRYKYVWARGKSTFETPKQQPKSGNATRVHP